MTVMRDHGHRAIRMNGDTLIHEKEVRGVLLTSPAPTHPSKEKNTQFTF